MKHLSMISALRYWVFPVIVLSENFQPPKCFYNHLSINRHIKNRTEIVTETCARQQAMESSLRHITWEGTKLKLKPKLKQRHSATPDSGRVSSIINNHVLEIKPRVVVDVIFHTHATLK